MKIAIYAIAKNEADNVIDFMSASEGVPVYVLDTGSTDDTPNMLRKAGAIVNEKIITPWRFDTARQLALSMVPDDIDVCISIDMDERLEKGWREKFEKEWRGNIGNYHYIASWANDECTIPAVEAPRTRIHSRHGFEWHRKIHEVIRPLPGVKLNECDTSIIVRHYQKGGQRNYEPALTELIAENPNDTDAYLQRAAEWMQKGKWNNAIEDYHMWLRLMESDERPVIRWRRANIYIGMAQSRWHLGDMDGALRAYLAATGAEPACRDAWVHVAHTALQIGLIELAYGAAMTAQGITHKPYYASIDTYCWGPVASEIAEKAKTLMISNQSSYK